MPARKYTNAAETLEYCKVIAEQFGLAEKALLQPRLRKQAGMKTLPVAGQHRSRR